MYKPLYYVQRNNISTTLWEATQWVPSIYFIGTFFAPSTLSNVGRSIKFYDLLTHLSITKALLIIPAAYESKHFTFDLGVRNKLGEKGKTHFLGNCKLVFFLGDSFDTNKQQNQAPIAHTQPRRSKILLRSISIIRKICSCVT